MIEVWADGGRIALRREGHHFVELVRVEHLPFVLYLMGVRNEPSMGRGEYPAVAHGAGRGAAARRAALPAAYRGVHTGGYAGPPRAR